MLYYFLAAALPPLSFDEEPEISLNELMDLYEHNLSDAHWRWVLELRQTRNLHNIRALWRGEPFSPGGTLNAEELEEALMLRSPLLPDYVYDFLDQYGTQEERLQHFPQLMTWQFNYWATTERAVPYLLREDMLREHGLRLVLAALRTTTLGRDLAVELQYEDPHNPLVVQLMAQKESALQHAPDPYGEIPHLYHTLREQPLALHRALSEWRFQAVEEILGVDLFSLSRLLGYLVQLLLVEHWQAMNREVGIEAMQRVVKG